MFEGGEVDRLSWAEVICKPSFTTVKQSTSKATIPYTFLDVKRGIIVFIQKGVEFEDLLVLFFEMELHLISNIFH